MSTTSFETALEPLQQLLREAGIEPDAIRITLPFDDFVALQNHLSASVSKDGTPAIAVADGPSETAGGTWFDYQGVRFEMRRADP